MSPAPTLVSAALLCGILQLAPEPEVPSPSPTESPSAASETSARPSVCEYRELPTTAPVEIQEATPSDEPSSEEDPSEGPTIESSPPTGMAAVPEDERQTPPVIQYTAATPEPDSTALRVLGGVSTGLLLAVGILALFLRLSVGRPRFPTPYMGRHRRSGQEP